MPAPPGSTTAPRLIFWRPPRVMLDLSKQATTEELRTARRETAQKLYDLAQQKGPKVARGAARSAAPASSEPQKEGDDNEKDFAITERPTTRFTDIAGLDDVKEEIRLKMVYPFQHADLAEKFGIRGGGGVLLYGPPGTGKTMLARATAGELDAAFYRVSAADVLSKWVGEAEQNVQKLFAAASAQERSVIFIDEIESLVPARRDDGSSVMQRVVPQILQGMEGFDKRAASVLFLGATNVPWQLDPAVLRPGRFGEKIYVPLPDGPARHRLLELYLQNRPLAADVDLAELVTRLDGYSGADIKHVCDRAALVPFLQAAAGDTASVITRKIMDETIAATSPSVTAEMSRRFEEWQQSS